ncbi:MAG: restriction endonuclease subunit S [Bacteroidales bacterium]|nr:restriction endonuclease subunit S [Bacteroidales bacterium]
MQKQILDIGEIYSGVYAKSAKAGEVYCLQARDFDSNRKLKIDIEPNVTWSNMIERHFLNPGDVLVAAKGDDNFAAVYCGKIKPAVASTMFMVIRNIDQRKILPDFLAWQINHPLKQLYLRMKSKGTSITSINKLALGEMEINIPSIEKQKAILSLSELKLKEKIIKDKLEYYRNLKFEGLLLNAIKE